MTDSRYSCCTMIWLSLILCSVVLSGCAVNRGPMAEDPEQALPSTALDEKAADLEYSDSITVRFTDGSSVQRKFRAVERGRLLTFDYNGRSQREYSDQTESVSGVQTREFQAIRTVVAAASVVGVFLVIKFMAECWSGCFE